VTSRRELEERVTQLAASHDGDAFVDAVRALAGELSDDERELLGEILVERSTAHGAESYAELTERMRAAKWHVVLPPPRERPRPRAE
jgi:hypothetical protein